MAPANLVVTKLIVPKRKDNVLRRQRLLDFLHEYIDRKLILIAASAGYGKTTLLVDFADDTELPVCWYSLDAGDRDPHVFLEYLLAAIQRRFPRFGARTAALLREPAPARNLDTIVGTLITEIHDEIESYFVIILDDYHLVDSSEPINRLFDNMLVHLPDNVHFILASRTLPTQLTLTRLTARLEVAGLGVGDLRFHADEIRALMQQNYQLDISDVVAEQLAQQSEGWITGIVLTTPTMWRGLFEDLAKERGPGSQLFEYLATEVFAQQPERLQTFLQETCILDQMNAALCDELLGITHAQAELEAIEARRLFIAHLEGDWYRYHHLFREFLEARQQQTNPARFRELHCRAAKIFERRGNLNEAIGHWLQSEAFDQAARLIEKAAPPLYDQGRWTTLAQWMDALPSEVLLATPDLLLRRGKIFAETGDLNQALATLETARVEFERRAEVTNVARVLIEEAVVARLQGQTRECLDKCEAALARLDSNQFALNALAYRTMGTALGRQGDWGGAISHLERALGLYQLASGRYDTALVEHDLGVALYTIGKRESANAHFQAALVYWRELGSAADLANTLNSIGVSHYYQGELDQARVVLEQALQEARRVRYLRIEALVLAGLGDVYRDSGEYERALQAYTEAFHIAEKIHGGFLLTYTLSAMADTWRLNGDLNLADQVARSAVDEARARRSEYEVALTQTALGALRLEQGQFNEAMTSLSQALGLFERGQAKRDAARVHYFLALAHFRQKQYDETRRHLDALASIGKALGEDQFILAEGLRAKPVVQFAVSRRVANGYFQRVLEKMRKIAPAPRLAAQLIEPAWPHLEVFTLGPARVLLDGQPVEKGTWQTATTKELFFYFAVHPHGWRKDQITARLWPELSRAKANDLFHVNVWRIRRGLYPECLVYRNGVYELNPEAERWVDVVEFERLLAEADRVVDEAQRATLLRRALDLYRGDFLEESYSDWCETRRAALVERYLSALMRLAEYHARLRDFARAIELYQAGLRKDNTREEIYRALMKLYIDMGDRASALHVYGRCVEILDEELEVAPMPETVALYKQIARKA